MEIFPYQYTERDFTVFLQLHSFLLYIRVMVYLTTPLSLGLLQVFITVTNNPTMSGDSSISLNYGLEIALKIKYLESGIVGKFFQLSIEF